MDHRVCADFGAWTGGLKAMITFEIVKEPYGWAVRRDDCMMMPAWCKAVAVEEAQRMVSALHRHGQQAQLTIAKVPDAVFAD